MKKKKVANFVIVSLLFVISHRGENGDGRRRRGGEGKENRSETCIRNLIASYERERGEGRGGEGGSLGARGGGGERVQLMQWGRRERKRKPLETYLCIKCSHYKNFPLSKGRVCVSGGGTKILFHKCKSLSHSQSHHDAYHRKQCLRERQGGALSFCHGLYHPQRRKREEKM